MKPYFHNPARREVALPVVLTWLAAARVLGAAEPTPELLDLAGRVEYGFYTREPRAIEAARAGLARLPANGPLRDYYAGLAAYRASLLAAADGGHGLGDMLGECLSRARRAADDEALSGEAWALTAACSVLGARHEPGRARHYQSRLEEALRKAAAADADNPRLQLVRVWVLSQRPAHEAPELREAARLHLEEALARFASRSAPFGFPDWGEAEALAHLGEIQLELGAPRAARDFVERALLAAPDYGFALALQKRVSSGR